jgi:prepilin-type N-terminal cleavage/methylation domain-containing protein
MNGMRKGVTLVELILAMGLFALLVTTAFVALNPGGQLASTRNTQRTLHLQALLNSIRQNMADTSGGGFTCAAGPIPSSTTRMASGGGNYDIAPCLVPAYLPTMPYDPATTTAHYTSNIDYDTGYFISRNASSGQVTLSAPAAELNKTISIVR